MAPERKIRLPRRTSFLAAALLLIGCAKLRTPALLQELNKSAPNAAVPKVEPVKRVSRLAKTHMADAYIEPQRVAGWLRAGGEAPAPLLRLVRCLNGEGLFDPGPCYADFMAQAAAGAFGLPRPPASLDAIKNRESAEAGAELDAERFLANARALAASLATLEQLAGRGRLPEADLAQGVAEGTRRAAEYIAQRRWHRSVARPTTAIVMSGGAANGAFSAGVIWRLMEVLSSCRGASAGGCSGAKIDLVAGTSTGTLIGLTVDLYSTQGHEQQGRDLLVHSYTCSVDSDLYCVNDEWDWALVGSLKGLVRFDGIRAKIESQVPPEVLANDTEAVAVSADFETGDLYAQSDQDPEDRGPAASRLDAVLASIVEPVLAEPVPELTRDGVAQRGTFLDGGVRSGLPLLEAVYRGAERVLVLSTSRIDPDPIPPPRNAVKILMRTIDLLSGQPRISEVQLAELAAAQRRMVEYTVCQERLRPLTAEPKGARKPAPGPRIPPQVEVESFCQRSERFHPPPVGVEAAAPGWMGPAFLPQVASSWRTSWIFRPEEEVETAEGYSFDPRVMRRLFELGAATFQRRCPEILNLLAIGGEVARGACRASSDEVTARARAIYRPIEQCTQGKPEIRKCR
jgi:predicted acylesterase/phospholipase RssA